MQSCTNNSTIVLIKYGRTIWYDHGNHDRISQSSENIHGRFLLLGWCHAKALLLVMLHNFLNSELLKIEL